MDYKREGDTSLFPHWIIDFAPALSVLSSNFPLPLTISHGSIR